MTAPQPSKFDEPWQAQLFALTVALNEAGHFAWPDWAAAFGATLKRRGAERAQDGGADYYAAWLETLEGFLDARGHAPTAEALKAKVAWEAAYLATPHGQPVKIAD